MKYALARMKYREVCTREFDGFEEWQNSHRVPAIVPLDVSESDFPFPVKLVFIGDRYAAVRNDVYPLWWMIYDIRYKLHLFLAELSGKLEV